MKKKKNIKPQPKKRLGKQKQLVQKTFIKSSYANLLGLAFIVLLGVIIYSNSFDCSFHLDDTKQIVDNINIRDLSDVKAIWNYSQTRFTSYYSFAINYHFDKLNVWGYHLFNLIIHLINACLVYWLSLLIFSSPALKNHTISKNKTIIAFLTALLFVSHPLATQSITYIVQRMASMVALFYLLSLALYIKGRLTRQSDLLKFTLFAGAFISAILAMLTKENSFTFPFAIVLVEIFFLQTKKLSVNFKDYRVILFIAGFLGFILLVLFNFSFSIFKPILPGPENDYRTVTSLDYLFTQFSVIVKYIQLLFLPINQNLDYDIPISNSFFEISTILSFLFLSSLIILAIFIFKKNRIISFGICWFFLTLSIESSIIPISDLIFEHRTYLPSFGFLLILSSGIYLLLWNNYKYIAISVFAILIGVNSFLAYERNKVWKDDFTLWSDVISKSPNKARAYNNRGTLLDNDKKYNEALRDYNKAIELSPNYAHAYNNRGSVHGKVKKYDEALWDYNMAIELSPNFAESYSGRGNYFLDNGKYDEALNDYNKAIELNPNFAEAYSNRGSVYEKVNKNNEALNDYNKAIDLSPNYATAYYNRGNIFNREKKYAKAIEDYTKAIALDPNFTQAYINRGMRLRDNNKLDEALRDYNKAVELKPNSPVAYYNRGNLFRNQERNDEALNDYSKAITLKPDFAEAYVNRGIIKLNSGKKDSACIDFQKAAGFGLKLGTEKYNKNCR